MTSQPTSISGGNSFGNARERLRLSLELSAELMPHFRSFHETLRQLSSGNSATSEGEPLRSLTLSDTAAA